ncbi:MAG: hypothetical protein ACKOA1_02155 [Bacteroidota bacterium]
MKHAVTVLFLLSSFVASAQMNDGRYVYSNSEITIEFTITDSGWDLPSVKVIDNQTKKIITGKGYWHKVNMAGVDEGYDGPEGWYEFQTQSCNYSFDEPKGNLVLQQFDCKNGQSDKQRTLTRKQ